MLRSSTDNTATSVFESDNVPSGAVAVDRAQSGGSFQSLAAAALLPHKDRCALVDIPELALRGKPSLKPEEVWDTFAKDFAPITDFFTCIQLVRPNRLRVWCPSATVLEDVLNTGLTLRGHPLRIKPIVDRCWLTITHLPYGLPEQSITEFFSKFGEVRSVRFVQFRKVFTGTVKVLMALHKTVPTRVRILGHAGLVYHPGQARTCFHCGKVGHESKRCPEKKTPSPKPRRKKRSRTPAPNTTKKQSSQPGPSTSVPPVNTPPDVREPNKSISQLDSSDTASPGTALPVAIPSTPKPNPSTEEELEVFSSPKGTFGPPIPTAVPHEEQVTAIAPPEDKSAFPAIPPPEERRISRVQFTDPPPVQNLMTSRKATRRNNPVPFVFGLDYGGPPKSTTGVFSFRKEKPDTRKGPSDPPNQVSSSSVTGLRTPT